MPRYAATLGFQPLEPVKSEILTPTPVDLGRSIFVCTADMAALPMDSSCAEVELSSPLDGKFTLITPVYK